MRWNRYGIYWVPDGRLGALGAAWLGWDARAGRAAAPLAEAPGARRYGFHATVKPPFRLTEGRDEAELRAEARRLAAGQAPAGLGRLELSVAHGFLALRPAEPGALSDVAAAMVAGLDAFRAAPTEAELARRRKAGLTPDQEENLRRWGYPYVMAAFHPHLTLSDAGGGAGLRARAEAQFAPVLGDAHRVAHLSLVGEDGAGRFHVIEDLALGHGAVADTSAF
jgi:hypothetical protein